MPSSVQNLAALKAHQWDSEQNQEHRDSLNRCLWSVCGVTEPVFTDEEFAEAAVEYCDVLEPALRTFWKRILRLTQNARQLFTSARNLPAEQGGGATPRDLLLTDDRIQELITVHSAAFTESCLYASQIEIDKRFPFTPRVVVQILIAMDRVKPDALAVLKYFPAFARTLNPILYEFPQVADTIDADRNFPWPTNNHPKGKDLERHVEDIYARYAQTVCTVREPFLREAYYV